MERLLFILNEINYNIGQQKSQDLDYKAHTKNKSFLISIQPNEKQDNEQVLILLGMYLIMKFASVEKCSLRKSAAAQP